MTDAIARARADTLTWARTEGLALATLSAITVVIVFPKPIAAVMRWLDRRRR